MAGETTRGIEDTGALNTVGTKNLILQARGGGMQEHEVKGGGKRIKGSGDPAHRKGKKRGPTRGGNDHGQTRRGGE